MKTCHWLYSVHLKNVKLEIFCIKETDFVHIREILAAPVAENMPPLREALLN